MVVVPTLSWAEFDYIDISNPFLRKIPIAIPLFKTVTDNEMDESISATALVLLYEALTFTSYFKILDRDAYLQDPNNSNITHPSFRNWTTIGAELLITGTLAVNKDIIEMELRLFDTFKEQLLFGKVYKGKVNNQRKIIHRFCSEVLNNLTGNLGFFNSKIAFVSTGSGNKEIYICEFDGFNPEQITYDNNIALFPAFSFNSKWIAYTSYVRGKADLYIKHLKKKRGSVIDRKGINSTPAWVPGKFALAATLSFSGDQEIYLLTGTGKIIKRLTHKRGIDTSPTWSPDGKEIAFVSRRSGSPQIYIKTLDSGKIKRLTFEGKYNTQPEWSSKGDKIVYSALEHGKSNIKVIRVDNNDLIQLTHDTGDNESPSWSPDGSHIVFSSTREGHSRIYVMTAYGTDQRRLLTLPGEQTNPNWSPRLINK